MEKNEHSICPQHMHNLQKCMLYICHRFCAKVFVNLIYGITLQLTVSFPSCNAYWDYFCKENITINENVNISCVMVCECDY